ncbi:MAG TPA: hypothetical protein VGG39_22350 [Polyangiaceae bacterium]
MIDRSRCVVLVPFHHYIEPLCDQGLRGLERLGYRVERIGGGAAIDRVRSQLATKALDDEKVEELLWIDADVGFEPADVDKLRAHELPLVGGVYARRGAPGFSSSMPKGTPELTFGVAGGLVEARHLATGFLLTHRRVYEDVARVFDLPRCNETFNTPAVPYFLPMVIRDEEHGFWYLSEDWSFSERARRAGYKPMIDTSIRLWHIGTYRYGWEDAATTVARHPSVVIRVDKTKKSES